MIGVGVDRRENRRFRKKTAKVVPKDNLANCTGIYIPNLDKGRFDSHHVWIVIGKRGRSTLPVGNPLSTSSEAMSINKNGPFLVAQEEVILNLEDGQRSEILPLLDKLHRGV